MTTKYEQIKNIHKKAKETDHPTQVAVTQVEAAGCLLA